MSGVGPGGSSDGRHVAENGEDEPIWHVGRKPTAPDMFFKAVPRSALETCPALLLPPFHHSSNHLTRGGSFACGP